MALQYAESYWEITTLRELLAPYYQGMGPSLSPQRFDTESEQSEARKIPVQVKWKD